MLEGSSGSYRMDAADKTTQLFKVVGVVQLRCMAAPSQIECKAVGTVAMQGIAQDLGL